MSAVRVALPSCGHRRSEGQIVQSRGPTGAWTDVVAVGWRCLACIQRDLVVGVPLWTESGEPLSLDGDERAGDAAGEEYPMTTPSCLVCGDQDLKARQLCRRHYDQAYRRGWLAYEDLNDLVTQLCLLDGLPLPAPALCVPVEEQPAPETVPVAPTVAQDIGGNEDFLDDDGLDLFDDEDEDEDDDEDEEEQLAHLADVLRHMEQDLANLAGEVQRRRHGLDLLRRLGSCPEGMPEGDWHRLRAPLWRLAEGGEP